MRAFVVILMLTFASRSVRAQWHVGLEVGTARYRGSSHDTTSSHIASEGGPGDATPISVRLGWIGSRLGIALRASYSKPGFAVSGGNITLSDKTTGKLYEVTTLGSIKVRGVGPSGAVRAEWGPTLHLWNIDGEIRSRLGAALAAAYEWPMTGRFSGAARLEGAVSKSWLDAADVPPDYERRVTWRYGVSLGLRYRM